MPSKKKNHFVPQFYMRNFGSDTSVSLFNIAARRHVSRASIAGQCQRDYLYGRDGTVEDALMKIETKVCQTIREMILKQTLPARDSQDYFLLTLFIAYQMARTPRSGASFLDDASKLARIWLRFHPELPEQLKDGLDDIEVTHPYPELMMMDAAGRNSFVLLDLEPALIRNESDVGFITSDYPAVKFNQWAQNAKVGGALGLGSVGLQILLPLSPNYLLLLYDPGIYSVGRPGKVLSIPNSYSIAGLNALQLTSAVDNLYFDGRAETLNSILKLPFEWRDEGQASKLIEAESEIDQSLLFHFFHTQVGKLAIPEIRLRRAASASDPRLRGREMRPAAQAAMEQVRGPRDAWYEKPSPKPNIYRVKKVS
jgi:hypothetical protein